jgi:flagellar motor switch protein FliG
VASSPLTSDNKAALGTALKKGLQRGAGQPLALASMDGPAKAAVILMLLGPDRATELMQHFSAEEVSRVSALLPSVQALERDKLIEVLEEFRSTTEHRKTVAFNAAQFTQSLLQKFSADMSSGNWEASQALNEQLPALESFAAMPPEMLKGHLAREHPQVAATLLSLVDPVLSAQVLELFEEDERNELVLRIALLDRIDPSVLGDLNEVLERAMRDQQTGGHVAIGGVEPVADILANLSSGLDRQTLGHIQSFDDRLAQQIQAKVFMFEDFEQIETLAMQALINEVPGETLQVALKGATPRLRQTFISAMTKRMADRVQFELDMMAPVKVQDAERRQREIIVLARRLEAQGALSLERSAKPVARSSTGPS